MDWTALLDPATAVPLLALLLAAGAAIGVLAGIFGIGGGGISVPVFYQVFLAQGLSEDVAMPLAIGTSLAMIVPTSIVSAQAHARKGTVEFGIVRAWAVTVVLGVLIGSLIARTAAPELFQLVFVFVASVNAIKLLFGKQGWSLRDTPPARWVTALYGLAVGLLSSLTGIGGGALSNLILTLNGYPIRNAVSTAAAVGVIVAIPGTLGYIYAGWGKPGLPADALGYVSLLALGLTAPTALLTTRLGVRIAHSIPQERLSKAFGLFLVFVAVRFAVELAV